MAENEENVKVKVKVVPANTEGSQSTKWGIYFYKKILFI